MTNVSNERSNFYHPNIKDRDPSYYKSQYALALGLAAFTFLVAHRSDIPVQKEVEFCNDTNNSSVEATFDKSKSDYSLKTDPEAIAESRDNSPSYIESDKATGIGALVCYMSNISSDNPSMRQYNLTKHAQKIASSEQ